MFYIQLIGVLAFCILVLSFYKKTPKMIMLYQVASNFIYSIHYFLLGALSGAFINCIGIFRNVCLMNAKKHKNIISILIILIYLLITIIFFEGMYSVLPLIANSQYVIAILKGNRKSLILGGIIGSSLWTIYAIFVNSYVSTITEMIIVISNTIQLIKLNKNKIK